MLSAAQVIDGRYAVMHRLGVGGMAEVYLATDTALGREVAVKILSPALAADPSFVERFKREARAAAALNHPNVVAVYNWGEYDGTYYIVMEYVPGENLRERLRREGALPEAAALVIAARVADALEAAHARGLVHRDVKPHNILLAPDGRVKVADFGIAWAAGAAQLTATNAVMGTAHYLSPEQVLHRPVDGRSDLYSLGIVLFEMLTDALPFAGDTLVAVAMKQANEPAPSVHSLRPEISARTDAIVRTALAKDPAARFQTAAAMRDAIDAAHRALAPPVTAAVRVASPQPANDSTLALPVAASSWAQVASTNVLPPVVRARSSGNPAPPPFLPPARQRTRWAIPLAGIGVLLALLTLGAFAGTRLFQRGTTATITPARGTQVAIIVPTPPLAPTVTLAPATAAPATAAAAAAVPASAAPTTAMPVIVAPMVASPTPAGASVATSAPTPTALPVVSPVPPTPSPATAVPALPSAPPIPPTARPPTPVPPTPIPPTPVPPTQPAPTVTPLPPTATPVPPPTPVPTVQVTAAPPVAIAADNATPIGAVRDFYALVSAHRFDEAAALWTMRQQQEYSPKESINGRFANTTQISVDQARISDQTADRATVAVTLTEIKQGEAPAHITGTWQLVRGPSGWLLDRPNLR